LAGEKVRGSAIIYTHITNDNGSLNMAGGLGLHYLRKKYSKGTCWFLEIITKYLKDKHSRTLWGKGTQITLQPLLRTG